MCENSTLPTKNFLCKIHGQLSAIPALFLTSVSLVSINVMNSLQISPTADAINIINLTINSYLRFKFLKAISIKNR